MTKKTLVTVIFIAALLVCYILRGKIFDSKSDGEVILSGHSHGSGCLRGRGNCILAISIKSEVKTLSEGDMNGNLKMMNDSTLLLTYLEDAKNEDSNHFYVENDMKLPGNMLV